jgi:elongation factor Ts
MSDYTPSAKEVKELRDRTGAGMMDCKAALIEMNGDLDKAIDHLRAKGAADAAKRAGREAREGRVESYIHAGGRVGVLLEVNCETDFVGKNDDFSKFAHDVALHIAAMNPLVVSEDEISDEYKERERAVYLEQAREQNVDEKFRDKAVDGKLAKHLKEIALLNQEFVLDQNEQKSRTIEELRAEMASKLGENITIRRFIRYELGG